MDQVNYKELWNLSNQSKHPTIGHVMFTARGRKILGLQVEYKSGKTFKYNRKEDIPKSVWKFLRQQNRHAVTRYHDITSIWYFMI